ncbi:serine/threonine-protein phosphatase Stp1 [Pseudomonas sp. TE6288]|jgi:serine/threonine-protein phosphatase Stp1|uniref:PP2C family protein-serine/threonine phosphatase n=1 Tax=Pseudomonas TaxID=286 RepID=UPI000C88E955|nr:MULTISPECIES: protein phosphatase 2C domain-containing protein [Pseudomonas]MBI6951070.1 serine/threonine-protein phosphatase [Pseudomonas sp. CCOS 191]PNA02304.1 serine/threonine protein phosphatase [Pseudomonas sp. FW305-42]PNA26611.1 serine/threonine protein phosphatase [Pseudomonas sp. MPR-R1B]PNB29170.1 serine/threonine protein phosphatase [Pseudomonas sp. DP16D-E2]PNB44414.1 serine/threonine protein phosphatase [Pseudomonas sp. FW305-17]
MTGMQYTAASYSHVGMVRKINEDACLELTWAGLWAVADGMGGHAAGDYVSSLAMDSLRSLPMLDSLDDFSGEVRDGLAWVNGIVREETVRRGVAMMGSTVVVLAARGDQAIGLWAGDSRLYRLRDGRIERLSHDHSYVQELQDSGLLNEAEARVHPRGNIVTRAIGVEDHLELQAVALQVQPGDTYLLCSDGLNKTAEDHEIAEVLGHADPYEVVRSLVHLGLTRGAPDNITAVVVKAS